MSATGIVALFSALSAASKGSHESLSGMLAMLSAMRYASRQIHHSQLNCPGIAFC